MLLSPIIGLEIHIQLKTQSKMFCSCDNSGELKPPNTTICPICVGHPGTLPKANKQAIEWAIKAALALNCQIPNQSKFDRKHYFYPDLPKGFQISQYDQPIGTNGYLDIKIIQKGEQQKQRIRIKRVHLEEDAAKLLHSPKEGSSFVDFNRAGTPLLEIVTEPDIRSPDQAKTFLQELRLIMRYLDISEADMEKGHLRCDANISLTERETPHFLSPLKEGGEPPTSSPPSKRGEIEGGLNPKTEIKNLNSFNAVKRALDYEIQRQTQLWEQNSPPKNHSTRGWNDTKQITEEQRTKEEPSDYRYFPEPDLPPLKLANLAKELAIILPELPQAKCQRFMDEYELAYSEAKILTEDKNLANYTEEVISELKAWLISLEELEGTEKEIWANNKKKLTKLVSNWLINKLNTFLIAFKTNIKDCKITPENFAEFITLIYQNKISSHAALTILEEMFNSGKDPSQILDEKDLKQLDSHKDLEEIVKQVIAKYPQVLSDYSSGKKNALQFLVGQIMKTTKGKANPQMVNKILKSMLS